MHKRVSDYGTYGRKRKGVLRRRVFRFVIPFLAGCLFMISLAPVIMAQSAEGDGEDFFHSVGESVRRGQTDEKTADKVNEMLAAELEREFAAEISRSLFGEVLGEELGNITAQNAAPVAEKERGDILVAIDPGHGGEDEGCSREGVLEKDINREIAELVRTKLCEMGYQVLLIREEDADAALAKRAELANDAEADVYVSIHQNACEEKVSDISGIETWYNEAKGDSGSKRLAQLIHSDLLIYSGAKDRGLIPDSSLYVIRETDMPACLVETGFLSNQTEREKLLTLEYRERLAKAIAGGIDLYFFPKTMYLTFDDGSTEKNTDAVLDILKEHEIKATFFLIGESVEKYPEVAERIVREGHTIGIHCYNHNYKKLYASADSYIEDFEKAHKLISDMLGVDVKLFRFPGGSKNSYNKKVYTEIVEEMTKRGYIYYDWNASLEDATKQNEPELLLRNAKDSTLGRRRIVMLAHDTVSNTVQCLDELIEQFPEYRMLPLTEEVEPIRF